VSVSNANGSATSAQAFTVVAPPTIAGVTPNTVARGFITRVQISGTNLRYSTAVTFTQAGITALILPGATDTSLPVDLRVSASVPAGSYSFTVADAAGSTNSGAVTVTVGIAPTGDFMAVGNPVSVFVPQAQSSPPAGDGIGVSPPTSVFLPAPAQSPPPSGDSMGVSPATSVFMPLATQSPPEAGSSQPVSPATSVFLPAPAQSPPPSGDAMGVSPTTSVLMP